MPNHDVSLSVAPSASRWGWRGWLALGIILVLGLVVRVAYLVEFSQRPDFRAPAVDAGFHDYWARGLATGMWQHADFKRFDPTAITAAPYLRPPGYPYFLAAVYWNAGDNPFAPRGVQMALALLSILLAAMFARRWLGGCAALMLAALLSLYWPLVYFEAELHAPVLLIPLLWGLALVTASWTQRATVWRGLVAGLLLGAAALVRPNALLLGPALVIWIAWLGWRRGKLWHATPAVLGLLIGSVLAISPATIRNYRVSGEFVPITTNLGVNLYIGNNPAATGGILPVVTGVGPFRTCFDYPRLVKRLEHKLGRDLSSSDVSRYFTGAALEWIREHPRGFLYLTAMRAWRFWGPREIAHNKVIRAERAHSSVLRLLPLNYVLILVSAGLGVVLWRRRDPPTSAGVRPAFGQPRPSAEIMVLLLVFVFSWFLSLLPFFVVARYRVPIAPFILALAACGLCAVLARWRDPRRRREAFIPIVLLLLAVWIGRPAPLAHDELAKWHADRGLAHARLDQTVDAQRELSRSVELDPDEVSVHFALGNVLRKLGRDAEAVRHYRTVLQLNPQHQPAQRQLRQITRGR